MVSLYFENIETNNLEIENRKIDAKKLANNPYYFLIQMLIDGPQDEKLKKIIPTGTKINEVYLKGNIAYVDLSNEFIENAESDKEEKIIKSIVNTLTELNEVTYIKILINGEENKEFKDGVVKFNEIFSKSD